MAAKQAVSRIDQGNVRGILHRPGKPNGEGLVLTHGAGGNAEMPLLAAVAGAFSDAGYHVLRCDLPFRQKRPRGAPSRSDAARDREGLREAVEAMRAIIKGRVHLGGQSYGGRQASMLAAEDPSAAASLLLFSYPLHPPGKLEQMRTAHFPSLRTPTLFVHGARDTFATQAELTEAVKLIPAPHTVVEIERAGHDLARGAFDLVALVLPAFERITR